MGMLTQAELDSWYTPKNTMEQQRTLLHAIKEAEEEERPCEDCNGTGEVSVMEAVYPGEPHMADVGTRKCHCQVREDEYDDQQ